LAMRLIGLAQQGRELNPYGLGPFLLPRFDGFRPVAPSMPAVPPPLPDPYVMEPAEQERFSTWFNSRSNGLPFVTDRNAQEFFAQSKLAPDELRRLMSGGTSFLEMLR